MIAAKLLVIVATVAKAAVTVIATTCEASPEAARDAIRTATRDAISAVTRGAST